MVELEYISVILRMNGVNEGKGKEWKRDEERV